MGTQEMILYAVITLIAGTVMLLLFTVQDRGQRASVDATQYRAAKIGTLNLVQMIEHDFRNIGATMHYDENQARFVSNHWYETENGSGYVPNPMELSYAIPAPGLTVDEEGNHAFRFRAQVDRDEPPKVVRYEWGPTGESVTLNDGTERDLYRVARYVDGSLSGSSESMVTSMKVDLHAGAGSEIENAWDARRIDVEISAVSPLGQGELIEQTLFRSSYRPVAMTIGDQMEVD